MAAGELIELVEVGDAVVQVPRICAFCSHFTVTEPVDSVSQYCCYVGYFYAPYIERYPEKESDVRDIMTIGINCIDFTVSDKIAAEYVAATTK